MENNETNDSFNYQYLSEEDIKFVTYVLTYQANNHSQILKSKNTDRKHPGIWNRIQQEFSTLIGIDENTTIPTKSYMLLHKMKELPKCPICGKYLKNVLSLNFGFPLHCSRKCSLNDPVTQQKYQETCLRDYGFTNSSKNENVKLKGKQTKLKRYGNENYFNIEKAKQTNLKRRGYEWPSQDPEVKKKNEETSMRNHGVKNGGGSKQALKKRIQTNRERRGVDYVWQDPKIKEQSKQKNIKNLGVPYPAQCPEVLEKQYETKRKNKSWNTSKFEKYYLEFYKEKYGEENVISQYQDPRYASVKGVMWKCDIYVKSLDLFIEIHGHQSHGPHAFDENNPNDIKLVEFWKSRIKPGNQYEKYIIGWTKIDVEKRETAKRNNLNFLEIWDPVLQKLIIK